MRTRFCSAVAYLEGTYTPTITFGTPGDLAVNYSVRAGQYIRIGNLVQFQAQCTFTVTYTTASGNLTMTAPFACANLDPNVPIYVSNFTNIAVGALNALIGGGMTKNTANVQFNMRVISSDAAATVNTTHVASGATSYVVRIGGVYRAA